jgi:hypothetical protein
LGVAFALMLLGGTAVAQDDPRSREFEALRVTVQQLEKSLQEVRAKLAEMEHQNQAGVDTNAVPTRIAIPPAATAPETGGSNSLVIAGQKSNLPTLPPEFSNLGRSPIPDYDAPPIEPLRTI